MKRSRPRDPWALRLQAVLCLAVLAVSHAVSLSPEELMETDEHTMELAKQEARSVDLEAQKIDSLVHSVPSSAGPSLPLHPSFKQMFPYTSSDSSSSSSSESGDINDERFVKKMLANMKLMAERDDPEEDQKLAEALFTIKNQVVYKAKTIKDSKDWVKKVTKLVDVYVKKVRRVHYHAQGLVNDYKLLLRKKRQVENMILQRTLEKRLKLLQADLKVVHGALENIQGKQTMFTKSKTDIKTTIGAMEDFLTRLRNKKDSSSSEESSSEISMESSSQSSSQSSGSSQSQSSQSAQSSRSQSSISSQSRKGASASSQSSRSKSGKPTPLTSIAKKASKQSSQPEKMKALTFSFSEVDVKDDPNELS